MATAVTACGGGGHATSTAHRHRTGDRSQASAPAENAVGDGEQGTGTVAQGVSASALPHGWTSCPAAGAQDAGAAAPYSPGCGFLRATEVQVQELLHNEGSTVFNTPESIGVSYRRDPQRLLNCAAQKDGPTIVCADNGVPWVIVFRPPGQ
jgi:hypothetical protein